MLTQDSNSPPKHNNHGGSTDDLLSTRLSVSKPIFAPPPPQPGEAPGTCIHHPTPRFPNDPPPTIPLPPHPG